MPVTSTDIVNQAIFMIGDNQTPVTGVAPTFDNSTAGKAAAQLYVPCVQTVAKQFGWDFNRNTVVLTLTGNTPLFPWPLEYFYPTNGVEVRQLMPTTVTDQFNPLPDNWVVCNNLVAGIPTKVIQTNVANALAVYTNQPLESTWDALFRETVVRLLASELAIAINGRPDTARDAYGTSSQIEQIGQSRDG
jgi:hypothetical protein